MHLPPKRYKGRRVSTTLSLAEDLVQELRGDVKRNPGYSFSEIGERYIIRGRDEFMAEAETTKVPDKDVLAKVDALAAKLGRTRAELIAAALEKFLAEASRVETDAQ